MLYIIIFLVFDLYLPGMGPVGSVFISLLISLSSLVRQGNFYSLEWVISRVRPLVFIHILILIYAGVIIIFYGGGEPSYIFSVLKSTAILVGVVCFYSAFSDCSILNKLIDVFAFNALVCFVFGSNKILLEYIYFFKFNPPPPDGVLYRNAFLAGSGYFGISAPYAIVFAISIIAIVRREKFSLWLYLKAILIAIAGVFAGRTMLVSFLASALFFLVLRPVRFIFFSISFFW